MLMLLKSRHLTSAVGDQIGGQAHRRARREDVGAARDVLLQDVVLDGALELARRHALLLAHRLVHGHQDGGGRVDGHGGADLLQGDAVEHGLHVAQGVDGDAHLPHLAQGLRVVGVVAELGGQVEGDAEAGLALVQQELEALVRLFRRAVAGVLADAPQAAAVHGGLDAAGVGILAGEAHVAHVVHVRHVEGRVQAAGLGRGGGEDGLPLISPLQRALQRLAFPAGLLPRHALSLVLAQHGPPSPSTRASASTSRGRSAA